MVMVNKADVIAPRQTYPGSVESVPASRANGRVWARQELSIVYKGAYSKPIDDQTSLQNRVLVYVWAENCMPV